MIPLIAPGDQFSLTRDPGLLVVSTACVAVVLWAIGFISCLIVCQVILSVFGYEYENPEDRPTIDRIDTIGIVLITALAIAAAIVGVPRWYHDTGTLTPEVLGEPACDCSVGNHDGSRTTWTATGQEVTYTIADDPESSFWHVRRTIMVTGVREADLVYEVTNDNAAQTDVTRLETAERLVGSGATVVADDEEKLIAEARDGSRHVFRIKDLETYVPENSTDGMTNTRRHIRAYYEEEAS